MTPPTDLQAMCVEALRRHLSEAGEPTLHSAYELARRAMAEGFGVLDMAVMLHRALREAASQLDGEEIPAQFLRRFESFALECFSPFEMAHRGAREANAVLRDMQERREEDVRRVAHELHDSAGQLLVSLHMALEDAARALDATVAARLDPVRARIAEVEMELRRLAHELRPTALDDLGLMPALHVLGEGIRRRAGIEVVVRGETEGRLPARIETALYRIVQEALTNVVRHAHATDVEVEVCRTGAAVTCRVRDNGIGFDPGAKRDGSRGGLGLAGMRERLVPFGGTLRVNAAPGRGTTLEVEIPMEVLHEAPHFAG